MYSNEKHRENGIFDIILSVVFYIMIFCAPFCGCGGERTNR